VLVSDSSEEYQAAVLQGAREVALAERAIVRSFAGGNLGSGRQDDETRNEIFDLVRLDAVDALIILSGAISDFCSEEHVTRFCERFQGLPLCTVGDDLPGIPSVRADNRAGVRSAIAHLLEAHDRGRIAFIQGPEGNQDATERYQAYVDALAEHGLPLETRRVVGGEFSFQSGAAAIASILDRSRLGLQDIDAVVAADDSMALGALSELGRRNIQVPRQVSVVGFDDVESARTCTPSLTTVRQHLREQGAAAVRILLRRLDGLPDGPMRSFVPTTVVLRRSCGCSGDDSPKTKPAGGARAAASNFEAQLVARRPVMHAELLRAAKGGFGAAPGWEERLIATLAVQLKTGSEIFLSTFRSTAKVLLVAQVDPGAFAPVLTVLRDQMLLCASQDADLRVSIERVIEQARAIAASLAPEPRTHAKLRGG
jgi:DNA-binding LacI/PurR family transcriptional regulator